MIDRRTILVREESRKEGVMWSFSQKQVLGLDAAVCLLFTAALRRDLPILILPCGPHPSDGGARNGEPDEQHSSSATGGNES